MHYLCGVCHSLQTDMATKICFTDTRDNLDSSNVMTGEASYMVAYITWKRHYAMYCVCPVQNSPGIGEAYFSSHIRLKGMTYTAQVVHFSHFYRSEHF